MKSTSNKFIPHGKGVLKFNNGQIFQGSFIQGAQHGEGTYSWPDGYKIEGFWVNGISPK